MIAVVTYISTSLTENKASFEIAKTFVNSLTHGYELSPKDPTYLLRERLLKDRASKAKLSPREKFALIIIA
jgi:hypothetical protein